jgi:hypothetical protein
VLFNDAINSEDHAAAMTVEWGGLHTKELYDLQSSPNITWFIK